MPRFHATQAVVADGEIVGVHEDGGYSILDTMTNQIVEMWDSYELVQWRLGMLNRLPDGWSFDA